VACILRGMPRTGRPRTDNPRDQLLRVRLTAAERQALTDAAEVDGASSLAEWVRARLLAAARRALAARQKEQR
jgi:uncharacterized protein (DUF1778 family)